MHPIPANCAYAPTGTKKVLLFFLMSPIEQRVINVLRERIQAIDELYCLPDHCVINASAIDASMPPIDMKIVMAIINGSDSAEKVAREARVQAARVNINLILEEMEATWAVKYAQLTHMARQITNVN